MINHHSFKIRVKLSLTQINIHQTQALSPTIKKNNDLCAAFCSLNSPVTRPGSKAFSEKYVL